jgi:hypothetical protein
MAVFTISDFWLARHKKMTAPAVSAPLESSPAKTPDTVAHRTGARFVLKPQRVAATAA